MAGKTIEVVEGWTGPGRRDTLIEPLKPSDDSGNLGSGGTFESGHLGTMEGMILYERQSAVDDSRA